MPHFRYTVEDGFLKQQQNTEKHPPMSLKEFERVAKLLGRTPTLTNKNSDTDPQEALFVICPNGAHFFNYHGNSGVTERSTISCSNTPAVLFFQKSTARSWVMPIDLAQKAGWSLFSPPQGKLCALPS